MSLSTDDIVFMDSTNGLGGALTSLIPEEALHNVFDRVSGKEAKLGDVEYRCVYIKNRSATDTLYNATVHLASTVSGEKEQIEIGLGLAPLNSTEQTITEEGDAPYGIVFVEDVGIENALPLGDLSAGSYKSIWIKRSILPNAPVSRESTFTLSVDGDIF